MLKVKNLIKNTPSMLHHIHQHRGVLRTPSNIENGDFCKNRQGTSIANCFWKKPRLRSLAVLPIKIVVRKFPIQKLKQKRANKVKN